MIPFHRIAAKLYNRPLLVTSQAALTISGVLLDKISARGGAAASSERPIEETTVFPILHRTDGAVEFHSPRASRFVGEYQIGMDGRPNPYRTTADGTAIITIIGELVNRGAWIGASSGLVSYEGLKHQLFTSARDTRAKAIVLDIESPGGEAVGCFEVAALVREVAVKAKPVIAVVNGQACSAAYAIASSATQVITIQSGYSGSVGVVMLHLDMSAFLELEGVKPTLIFAGAHKVDGNQFQALPDDVRARFQEEVMQFYGLFVECVASGRGMSGEAVAATEADIYCGQNAVDVGFADAVGTFEDVVDDLATIAKLGTTSPRIAATRRRAS